MLFVYIEELLTCKGPEFFIRLIVNDMLSEDARISKLVEK